MAGLVSQQTLERIRAASEIVDVISAYVPLKRAGASFVALVGGRLLACGLACLICPDVAAK
jgi:hypothetical protein